jgi:RNA polymerase sigma-70 factor (ECF subfamily)
MNEVQDKFFQEAFQKSLTILDDKHKEVFSLRHLEGLSIKEIAEVLEISDGTVKSRLFYATKYLAESLKEFNPVENR